MASENAGGGDRDGGRDPTTTTADATTTTSTKRKPTPPPPPLPTRDPSWWQARGFPGPIGLDNLSLWRAATFSWASPLIDLGSKGKFTEATAEAFLAKRDDAGVRAAAFENAYQRAKAKGFTSYLVHRALFYLHWREMLLQILWLFAESATRIGSALSLRSLLVWLSSPERSTSASSLKQGWARASAMIFCTLAFLIIHHQLFWVGMHTGYRSRLEVTCAIHSKLLKLSAASLAASAAAHADDESGDDDVEKKSKKKKKRKKTIAGDAVNLASSDVRRLDDAGVFWPFLLVAPLELLVVFALLASKLGPAAAAAGCAPLVAFVPGQALVSRRIGKLRAMTAARTDARARAAAEAVNGALTVKMLAAGESILRRLLALRKLEEKPIRSMSAIRATNMALYFMAFPIAAFLMFATVAATRPPRDVDGEELPSPLTIPNVFYALALLRLPVLYLGIFFIAAVEKVAELAASLKRLDAFLALEEPPPPAHLREKDKVGGGEDDESDVPEDVAVAFRGADFDWGGGCKKKNKKEGESVDARLSLDNSNVSTATATETDTPSVPTSEGPTLKAVTLHVKKGELLGIAGPVGSGKSSLLLALLSELLPCPKVGSDDESKSNTGLFPVVRGTVSYCSQVPWIPPGTLRDAVVFGGSFDEDRYERAIEAAALRPDLDALPAGDLTEIGERGVNLSGGQRARVALARAAYADADVVLLDDPLSALDARVGAAVFERCIANRNDPGTSPSSDPSMMSGKTRLLVTHARHYLPRCDRVAVLRDGEVVALGTPSELAEKGLPELAASGGGAGDAGGGEVDAVADAAAAAANEDADDLDGEERDARKNDLDAAGVDSEWDRGNGGSRDVSRPRTPVELAEAVEPASAPASNGAAARSSTAGPAASRLRRAISKNVLGGGVGGGSGAEGEESSERENEKRRTTAAAFGASVVGGGRLGGSLRLAASRRSRGGGTDPATLGGAAFPSPRAAAAARLSSSSVAAPGRRTEANQKQQEAADDFSTRLARGALVKAEGRAEGGVGANVYASWASRLGPVSVAFVAVGLVAGQAAYLFAEFWVSILSPSPSPNSPSSSAPERLRGTIAGRAVSQQTWLEVYGALTLAICVLGASRALAFFDASVRAASSLHSSMVESLVRAPLAFYHTTPAGRILNRLTKDQGIADDYLPQVAFDSLQSVFQAFGALVLLLVAVPFVAPVLIPLGMFFAWVRSRYLAASRDVKRYDGTTRSPVFAMLAETPRGLPTIRAFGSPVARRLEHEFEAAALRNIAWWGSFVGCARWIGFRIDFAASSMLIAETALVVALPSSRVSPRLAGLALVHAVSLSGSLQWAVRQTAEWEVSMTSVERMLEVSRLPTEEDEVGGGGGGGGEMKGEDAVAVVDAAWPVDGKLDLDNVSAYYRRGLPRVLRDVSFTLPAGCRAGVVGRSGSGKSSLVLALFRLIPLSSGRVLLGGVDISTVPLERLRRSLAVIPQDPFLFAGTVRTNLDPLSGLCCDGEGGGGGERGKNGNANKPIDDVELWAALEAVGLKAAVKALPGRLDALIAGGGENLSVGQRQLFSAARALLRRPKLLIADEATANVDAESDAAIQSALRSSGSSRGNSGGCGGCFGAQTTVITIAHRLDTVMGCDSVLVFGSGRLLERGPPAELSTGTGPFARLVAAAQRARGGGRGG